MNHEGAKDTKEEGRRRKKKEGREGFAFAFFLCKP
jgi:hypothetical protein